MGIYRGPGGTGDAVADTSNQSASAVASAAAAAASATAASSSASSASTSATNAANSATSAATSASNASTSATNAANSASSAATSASNAAASYDSFDDRYLGAKSSAPTVDNDGDALITGALYWNTTDNKMYAWSGSSWEAITTAGGLGTVTSVAMTVPTGLSISGSPITSSGTLAVSYASGYAIPTTVKQSEWDTAYGWGNHASAGYLTSSAIGTTVQGYDADLQAIGALAGTSGLLKKTAANTWTLDTSTYLTSLGIGSQTQAWDADLDAISALSGTSGFLKKTAANTWALDTNTYLTSYTETDPVFVASPAYNITGTKISNWDDSYTFVAAFPSQTGNSGKYLTTDGSTLSWATVSGGGVSALDDLTDVVITSASAGQVLKYNGTNWVNDTDSTGSGSFAYPTGSGIVTVSSGSAWGTTLTAPTGDIVGTTDSQTLTNKTISGASNTLSNIGNSSLTNSSITINGTAVSLGGSTSVGTVTSVAATAGTGISISGSPITGSGTLTITNTAPDQTVALTGAGTTSISGTYPNFTITSNDQYSGTVTSVSGTGTVNGITLTGSVTSSGSLTLGGTLSDIGNAQLTNSSITVNGTAIALGASGTITAANPNALTIGTGLSGTSYTGSSAVTIAIDSTVATLSGTQTLTNKRITPRVSTTTSSATPTINTDNVDMFGLTAQAVDITSFTTNLSGTPTDGQKLWIYIVGTAARAITWGASFEASTVALPTTTVSTNRLDVGFVWNAATSKWRCVAAA